MKFLNIENAYKEILTSLPETQKGSAALLFMRLNPDQETGTHNLPLRGCAIQTAVSPDTTKIPAELFLYLEKEAEWEEKI